MLVNRLLSEIFDEEIAQFLEDGIFNKPNTLLNAAYVKFLEFPPVQRDKARFEQTLNEVLSELPDLIHAYNKYVRGACGLHALQHPLLIRESAKSYCYRSVDRAGKYL